MKANPNPKANRHILMLTYGVVLLFVGLGVYFGYFLLFRSDSVINNSYNARLDSFADRVVRGEIYSSDGRVLAKTEVDGEGKETRVYPYDSLFAHVVGYSTNGKTGLEALSNFYLLTSHVNLIEQVVNEWSGLKNPGDSVFSTLDVDLQKAAFDALGKRKGAVVVMEPDTGKILAMVSKPDYNPNTLAADWSNLVAEDNNSGQLLNRATQGLYPPGSTFKLVTALEYMRENPANYRDYIFDCNGIYKNADYTIRCYHETAHGHQNLEQAFANSCNGAFSNLGLQLNLNKWKNTADQLLFNTDLPLPIAGNKSSYSMEYGADTWEILQTAIGQGQTQITPIHNAMIVAAIANGGTLMKPYLIDHVENAGGDVIKKFLPQSYGNLMTAVEASDLTEFMGAVVRSGTGSALRTDAYTVAGKTGSAEFEKGKETHAWFIGFAPAEQPRVVISVIAEESGSGGQTAAPIARTLFDLYFSRQ
ncbi:peptidoglycan D,D-transpeptidase FtsI family protein [Lacrimispora saccharolytica]|uniref:Peptidoglycan glycosyltransferase n=1 Tax=Lacrimispora saccharolytica (strain ATCC 35040 / DSM 2544 / NRCC 2533 / WM1) TaxID=610130 RepID=D9R362_LACSW|nr:penicillin-binding transpeptidase domain-containing protein [Lacrimispora saccharolytica]ADL04811.1 Peptidoglycan glycosyltransferase [[Clostridium] saccharolyticum WM1]